MSRIAIVFLWTTLFTPGYFLDPTLRDIVLPKNVAEILNNTSRIKNVAEMLNNTRRILKGKDAGETRKYMVYIRPAPHIGSKVTDVNWLCGGAIIHERYVLTSAACIEEAQHFYVISGTNVWTPLNRTNDCIKNGAKKAIWKCVPKNYVFDGESFNNIHWMIADIAVVKIEAPFNFERRIKGCEFIPEKIAYNNESLEYEKPGTVCTTVGWGTQDAFTDDVNGQVPNNSEKLLETDVLLVSKDNCKKRWPRRYHYIIDEHMLCGKDATDGDTMSSLCLENEVNCKELAYSDEDGDLDLLGNETRRMVVDPEDKGVMVLRSGNGVDPHLAKVIHDDSRRIKYSKIDVGGFCENDHGGPLVSGHGKAAVVVGVISACQTHKANRRCYGPFLYTSVYKHRNLISCTIDKEVGFTCRRYLRGAHQTAFDWSNHPDGPAKEVHETVIAQETEKTT